MPRLDELAQACYPALLLHKIKVDLQSFAGEITGLLNGLVT